MNLSHVGMVLCPICEEPAAVALDPQLKESLPRQFIDPTCVCDDCQEKYLTEGVMIVCVETGEILVVHEDGWKACIDMPIPPKRIALCDPDAMALLVSRAEPAVEAEAA